MQNLNKITLLIYEYNDPTKPYTPSQYLFRFHSSYINPIPIFFNHSPLALSIILTGSQANWILPHETVREEEHCALLEQQCNCGARFISLTPAGCCAVFLGLPLRKLSLSSSYNVDHSRLGKSTLGSWWINAGSGFGCC